MDRRRSQTVSLAPTVPVGFQTLHYALSNVHVQATRATTAQMDAEACAYDVAAHGICQFR